MSNNESRRNFLKSVGATGISLGAAANAIAAKSSSSAKSSSRVIGANDRINVALIGCGGRGRHDADTFARVGSKMNCQIVAACDVYQKRVNMTADKHKVKGYLDYREVLALPDLDAVIIATPDHWHGKMAMDAMDHGKDVYLEKPMVHTNEEARLLVNTVKETKRILQVGSQTTSADIWWKAKKAIADGMIGQMIESQGSYHRNSVEGEWNEGWPIDPKAGPDGKGEDYIDWNMWLGSQWKLAPKRPYDGDRFFRFRKYWDYSLGIASDLFYHVIAPLNICWDEPQFPTKVMATGGIYVFKKLPDGRPDREVPDTFHLLAEYAKGHSLVLSSSMANDTHIPGMIRGHEGTIIMVEHGMFERSVPYITVKPQLRGRGDNAKPVGGDEYAKKFGTKDIQIPVEQKPMDDAHVENFLACMRSREKPHLDVETGAKAVVVINLAAQSYREGRTLYWDAQHWKATDRPVKA